MKVEVVVDDEHADAVVDTIYETAHTGEVGDGRILIADLREVIHIRTGQVELGPRYSVTNQLQPVQARDPGEFTGGIWEYLYPPRPSTFPAP